MSTLQDFLLENPVDNVEDEVKISERFGDLKFKIRAMSWEQYSEYQKGCTKIAKKGKVEFNSKKFNELVIINHTIEPNFKNAEMLAKANCQTPEQFLYKYLLAGEISELAQQISILSGFDRDLDDEVDEAKNS